MQSGPPSWFTIRTLPPHIQSKALCSTGSKDRGPLQQALSLAGAEALMFPSDLEGCQPDSPAAHLPPARASPFRQLRRIPFFMTVTADLRVPRFPFHNDACSSNPFTLPHLISPPSSPELPICLSSSLMTTSYPAAIIPDTKSVEHSTP